MSNQNNLYNILAAFNKATQETAETPKQQARAIYESVEAKGSITSGVKGVEKKLAEAYASHKVDEVWSGPNPDKKSKGEEKKYVDKLKARNSPKAKKDYDKDGEIESEKDEVIGSRRKAAGLDEAAAGSKWQVKIQYADPSGTGIASATVSVQAPDKETAKRYAVTDATKSGKKNVKATSASSAVTEGRVKQLQMDLEELTDAEFKTKYKMSKAEARKGMNEGIMDEPDTVDTPTGRIHRAKPGGYGRQDQDDFPANPANDNGAAPRGRGRPKGLPAQLRAQKAAELAARGIDPNAPRKRGRPAKNPAGGANSAPAGTLGLHNFLFGPAPKTLPGKPGVKHKMSDQGTERDRVRSITGESARPTNLKGYLAESVGTLDHIMNRFKNEVKRFQSGEDLDQDLYEALFDYYMDSGEMPYGVAKARSGDPYEWVTQRFDDEIGVSESSYPSQEELDAHHEESLGRRNDSIHAEAADNEPSRARQHYTPDVPKTDVPKKTSWLRDPIAAATDRIYDKIKGVKEDGELNELARLAGIKTTNESASVISGDYDGDGDHDMHDHEVESEDRGTMSVSTNQSSTGTKNVTVTADGEAASALLDMLKNAGMGSSDAARDAEQRVTAVVVGSDEQEVDEEYANEPAPQYQSTEAIMARGDDMNRQKKQNFPLRAPGNNPMAEGSDPLANLGRDLMAEYQALKLKK